MYKKSSLTLFKLSGITIGEFKSEEDETYGVSRSITNLENKAFHDGWQTSEELIDALLHALHDNKGNYAGYKVAKALIRCNHISNDVIECLEPWNKLVFTWKRNGFTSESIARKLLELGIPLNNESLSKIDDWLKNPASSVDKHYDLLRSLFGARLYLGDLRDKHCYFTDDDYAIFFSNLASICHPSVPVEEVKQHRDDDFWAIEYTLNGRKSTFHIESMGTWFNIEGMLLNFNRIMREENSNLRAFGFDSSMLDGGQYGYFIVADKNAFPRIAEQLYLPVYTHDTDIANHSSPNDA